MKKMILGMLSFILLLTGCSGGLGSLEPDHYLYEVTDMEGNVSYLLGATCFGPNRLIFDGLLKEVYEKVDSLVIELDYDINQEDTKKSQECYLSYPLTSYVGDEEFDMIWSAIKEDYPVVTDEFLKMNAFYTRDTITLDLWESVGLKNMYAIDYSLFTLANDDGKEIHEIMSYSDFCDRTSLLGKNYAKLILASVLDRNAQEEYLEHYMGLYRLGMLDEESISRTMISLNHIPSTYQTDGVIAEAKTYPTTSFGPNNEEVVAAIETYMKQETTLAAVSVDHLFGENNVIDLLTDKGYTIVKCKN